LRYHSLFSSDFTIEVYCKRPFSYHSDADFDINGSLNISTAENTDNGSNESINSSGAFPTEMEHQEVEEEDVLFQNFHTLPQDEEYFRFLGKGWCVNPAKDRIKLASLQWTTTSIRADQGAYLCEDLCAKNPTCLGYMTQDGTKCDVILSTDSNAIGGISQAAQAGIGADDEFTYCWVKQTKRPRTKLSIQPDGYVAIELYYELPGGIGGPYGGKSRTRLHSDTWHHVAVVVRRSISRVAELKGHRFDSSRGEVALFVDGSLDTAWPMERPWVHFGPERRYHATEGELSYPMPARNSEFAIASGEKYGKKGLLVSKLRFWNFALEAGDTGLCHDFGVPASATPTALGNPIPQRPLNSSTFTGPAFSFSFGGSLAEAAEHTIATPTGDWSFIIDAPPRCQSLTQSPYDGMMEHCVQFDYSAAQENLPPYRWHSPQAYAGKSRGPADTLVDASHQHPLTASTHFTIYRKFVNEPPSLRIQEPRSGVLEVIEDQPTYFSMVISHKAEEQDMARPIAVSLTVSHGHLRSLSSRAVVRLATGSRKGIEYRGPILDVNQFLTQVEYAPDSNYAGPDLVVIDVSDMEFQINFTMQVTVTESRDPLVLVCPPAEDILEGSNANLIGRNISIHDNEPIPGQVDYERDVLVELGVGAGRLFIDRIEVEESQNFTDVNVTIGPRVFSAFIGDHHAAGRYIYEAEDPEGGEPLAAIVFNASLTELRYILHYLRYTPYPKRYHGVVHFGLTVTAFDTGEQVNCNIGISVHPVNSPPSISVDQHRLLAATGGVGTVYPYVDVPLAGVIQLYDPDLEEYTEWFAQRTHVSRLSLGVNCGSLSLDLADPEVDYELGVQNGSIAGTEGLTFHAGDGLRDTFINVTSTLDHLNGQLWRLYYHSQNCREEKIVISVHVDDLGNWGDGGPLTANTSLSFNVAYN
jgi:hypothetical protein